MSKTLSSPHERTAWLRKLYLTRAAFSLAWVALAVTLGKQMPLAGMLLLVLYPAWDAAANLADARMSGGLESTLTQRINLWVSVVVTAAVAISFGMGLDVSLIIFGLWAILSGVMQLATAIRRRKGHSGQWVMILSGAQSALAGAFFLTQQGGSKPALETIPGYATVGAVYFLISGLVILWRERKAGALVASKG